MLAATLSSSPGSLPSMSLLTLGLFITIVSSYLFSNQSLRSFKDWAEINLTGPWVIIIYEKPMDELGPREVYIADSLEDYLRKIQGNDETEGNE